MQLVFSWPLFFDVFLSILWLISGIRDFMGKDPWLRLPFNQYERDPEYRAFWQKKNGVLFIFNAIGFSSGHLPAPSSLGRQLAVGRCCGRCSLPGSL